MNLKDYEELDKIKIQEDTGSNWEGGLRRRRHRLVSGLAWILGAVAPVVVGLVASGVRFGAPCSGWIIEAGGRLDGAAEGEGQFQQFCPFFSLLGDKLEAGVMKFDQAGMVNSGGVGAFCGFPAFSAFGKPTSLRGVKSLRS